MELYFASSLFSVQFCLLSSFRNPANPDPFLFSYIIIIVNFPGLCNWGEIKQGRNIPGVV